LQDRVEAASWFDVEACDFLGRSYPHRRVPGFVCVDHRWSNPLEEE